MGKTPRRTQRPLGIVPDNPGGESEAPLLGHLPRHGDSGDRSPARVRVPYHAWRASGATLPPAVRSRRAPGATCCSSHPMIRDGSSSRSRSSTGLLPRCWPESAPRARPPREVPSSTAWSPPVGHSPTRIMPFRASSVGAARYTTFARATAARTGRPSSGGGERCRPLGVREAGFASGVDASRSEIEVQAKSVVDLAHGRVVALVRRERGDVRQRRANLLRLGLRVTRQTAGPELPGGPGTGRSCAHCR